MENRKIKLIIFDLDDTLYDEKKYVKSGFKASALFLERKTGIPSARIYKKLLDSFRKFGRGKNFNIVLDHFGISHVAIKDMVRIYQRHTPDIQISKRVRATLRHLEQNYKLCLITNGWPWVQKKKIDSLGLRRIFNLVLYAEENGHRFKKPHKKYFIKAMRHFRVRPHEVLVAGDDPVADGEGAKSVGVAFILIHTPGDIKKVLAYAKRN